MIYVTNSIKNVSTSAFKELASAPDLLKVVMTNQISLGFKKEATVSFCIYVMEWKCMIPNEAGSDERMAEETEYLVHYTENTGG